MYRNLKCMEEELEWCRMKNSTGWIPESNPFLILKNRRWTLRIIEISIPEFQWNLPWLRAKKKSFRLQNKLKNMLTSRKWIHPSAKYCHNHRKTLIDPNWMLYLRTFHKLIANFQEWVQMSPHKKVPINDDIILNIIIKTII